MSKIIGKQKQNLLRRVDYHNLLTSALALCNDNGHHMTQFTHSITSQEVHSKVIFTITSFAYCYDCQDELIVKSITNDPENSGVWGVAPHCSCIFSTIENQDGAASRI